jgi:tetratricopeptide (TPR) repeat protein
MINAYPEVWLSYYSKAHQEYQLKNYKAAKELSEVALSKQTNDKSYYMLARSSFELNEPRTVISAIENAINLEPNYLANLSAMKIYAVSLASEGLYDQAIIAIEEVKKQNEQAADDEELDKLLQELKNPEKKNGETQQFN